MLKLHSVVMRMMVLVLATLAITSFVWSGVPTAAWFVPDGAALTATQMAGLFDTNQLYFNVQSETNSNGEIRGDVTPAPVIYQTDAGNPFAANPANNPLTFAALLGGEQVRPRNVITGASGYGSVTLDPLTKQLSGFIVTSGIAGIAAQIHDGLSGNNGTVVLTLEGGPVVWTVPATTVLTDAQIARLTAGAYYFNVQSDAFSNGEIRGQLNQQVRFAALKGAHEIPPVASGASGIGILALDPVTRQFSGFVKAGGFGSAVTSVALRFGDAVTNGPGILNLVTSGNGIWSVPAFNNPVVSDAIVAAFNNDALYVNIHTQDNPGGELRGQIMKSSVRIGTAGLDGTKEIPPVSTLATGSGVLAWNSVTGQLSGSVKTDGLTGTAANLHSGPVSTTGPALVALTTTSPVTVTPAPGISFGLDIQPIFTASCARSTFCHVVGGNAPMSLQSGFSYASALTSLVPGDSAASYFYQRVTINDPPSLPMMPLNRPPLSLTSQNLIKNWIDSGALFDFYPVSVTVAANPAGSQVVGTPVTFSAATQAGIDPYEYRFYLNDGSGTGFVLQQDYGAQKSWTWVPEASGRYDIFVEVRYAGTTVLRNAFAVLNSYEVKSVIPPSSVTLTASSAGPQPPGTPVTFTAAAQGGTGPCEYRFYLNDGSGNGYVVAQPYGPSGTFVWTPDVPGNYDLFVETRLAGSTVLRDAYAAINFFQVNIPPTSVTLTANPAGPQAPGTPVTFSAAAQGASGPCEYRFHLNDGSGAGYVVAQPYGPSGDFIWTPSAAGNYDVFVETRLAGSTSLREAYNLINYYRITAVTPPTAVNLVSDVVSPQTPGTLVTFTAAGQGGSGPYEYRFYLNSGAGFVQQQDYSPTNSWNWTPAAAGNYDIFVEVRQAGSSVLRDAYNALYYYRIQ
ncbi:MAG: CHRD domain-containing protein [Geobacteraceae bacterium]|nr:CHRD domain-containing protein [Geobacteraceae bacterium]